MPSNYQHREVDQFEPIPRITVQVCEDVYRLVRRQRRPDEDFSNALRRILFEGGIEGGFEDRPVCPATPRYWGLTAGQLEVPLLQALSNLGGAGSRDEVEAQIEDLGILTADDLVVTRRKVVLWKHRLSYARGRLVRGGYISTQDGPWHITKKGQARLELEQEFPTPIPPPQPHDPVRFYN